MTARIAIVGANGRVGTELSLRLTAATELTVVPVVRNRDGSAFLRLAGVECRHGRVQNLNEARRLLGDCDVVLHLAYAFPRSRSGHRANVELISNVVHAAPSGARLILASTIMVYAPNLPVRFPGAYGVEKILLERRLRREAATRGSLPYVLRIGHVLGDLQPLSANIRREVASGPVALPDGGERPSNTVFAATLAEIADHIAGGRVTPGVYDAVTAPQWTWRRVYEFHAASIGATPEVVDGERPRPSTSLNRLARASLEPVVASPLREHVLGLMQVLPDAASDRAYGAYLRRRARAQTMEPPQAEPSPNPAVGWRAVPVAAVPGLHDPQSASRRYPLAAPLRETYDVFGAPAAHSPS